MKTDTHSYRNKVEKRGNRKIISDFKRLACIIVLTDFFTILLFPQLLSEIL